jgi:processive 1,2-diacylglycerol beta-glucosyltransferase
VEQVRILVLTSSTGGGHDARAEAFADWCFQLYQHGVDVRIEQMLERSSVVNRGGVHLYNWIQRRMPFLHSAYYAIIELLALLNQRTVALGRRYYTEVLRDYRPHLILSVHDCLNRGYFQLARQVLAPQRVRCVTYCGEFSGGWGYSVNWIEPTVDLYFSRTPTARDFAVRRGIPAERCRVRGHLMLPRAHRDVFDAAGLARFRESELGLLPDRFTVFLATGGNGANNHFELLPSLLRYANHVQAIVICGRDKETHHALVHWRAQHPALRMYIEGYSEQVHRLMQASDVIVTRGGTTTCAKALHFRCPILFNAFGGIMPQERLTWKFFRNGAGSEKIESAEDFERILIAWMQDRRRFDDYRRAFLGLRYEEDPTLLIDEIVNLAAETSEVKLERRPFVSIEPRETEERKP